MTDSRRVPYSTPAAFDRAVTDRLRSMAAPHSPWPLADLKRQFAYDRLLVRLYQLDDAWVLKGATALLARGIAVRHTVDVDVYRLASARHVERDLRAALLLDAGDWFEFHAGASRPVADGATGVRIPITVRLGAREWPSFRVDVVADDVRMTGQPDDVPTLTMVAIPGLELSGYPGLSTRRPRGRQGLRDLGTPGRATPRFHQIPRPGGPRRVGVP